jgi:uncharacterized protein
MKLKIIHVSLQILGIIMILLGIIGLFLPILQGVLFIIIGLVLFSIGSNKVKAWIDIRLEKFPRIKEIFNRHHANITDTINKRT